MTLFELKEKMATLNAAIVADAEWIAEKAANPEIAIADIDAKKAHRDELQKRYEMLKEQHDGMESAQKAALAVQQKQNEIITNPKNSLLAAKGEFYKAVLTGGDVRKAYQMLGAIPASTADLGYGENLLPVNMSNEIISEPFDDNPMRTIIAMSNITGLVMPKLDYTIDDDFITDKDVATELEMTGSQVVFGRFKSKIKAKVSDTVLRGTATALATWVDNALRSGLAGKEKKVMFAATPTTDEAHMSFYSTANAITTVTGATMYEAIIDAIGDLNDRFAARAGIVMRRVDYLNMIKELANNSATLWGAKPEDVIGYPVTFCDAAIKPVVGDFSQIQLNYDIGATFDTDKDVDAGIYLFVLTAWFDIQIKLKSAFRLVEVV